MRHLFTILIFSISTLSEKIVAVTRSRVGKPQTEISRLLRNEKPVGASNQQHSHSFELVVIGLLKL